MSNPYLDPNYNPYPPSVLVGTGVFFIILSVASVALRFYSRSISRASFGVDDWICIPAAVICVTLAITQIIATTLGGLGSHQILVDGELAHTEQLYIYEKTKYTYQVLGTVGLYVVKLSILLFYRRIFSVRASRIVNNVFIGLTTAWGFAFIFTVAFQCTPVDTIWNKFELEYGDYCIEVQPFYLSIAISDLLLDVIIFFLPLPHLYQLKMPLRQKLAVSSIFLLGGIVVAIGITRAIIFNWVISFTMQQPETYFRDITWYTAGTLFWHLAENVVGLLGCCVPTYAPLFRGLLQKARSSQAKPSQKSYASLNLKLRAEDEISFAREGGNFSTVTKTPMGSRVYEDHALADIPQNRIMVNREFSAERSIV